MDLLKGAAIVLPGVVFFATLYFIDPVASGTVKIVFASLTTMITLTGITMLYSGNKKPGV